MRVAIAVEAGQVASHFGRCERYLVADVVDGTIRTPEEVANPGHQPGVLPAMLHGLGVECVVAGGMGPRAQEMFQQYGIATIVGVTGDPHEALLKLASGTLRGGPSLCDH